jgi:hypothetical protein
MLKQLEQFIQSINDILATIDTNMVGFSFSPTYIVMKFIKSSPFLQINFKFGCPFLEVAFLPIHKLTHIFS